MSTPSLDAGLRVRILNDPDALLSDIDVMRALTAANERAMGRNIVDIRGIAMARLEDRLDRLEETHRCVIAAAYDNVAGTSQVHRAILRLLEADRFETFLASLASDVARILRIDALRLVLETDAASVDLGGPGHVVRGAARGLHPGLSGRRPGRVAAPGDAARPTRATAAELYGDAAIRSEALLLLDFGPRTVPGLLALGAGHADQFAPQQGTDLLAFFAGVFERVMRRWLA